MAKFIFVTGGVVSGLGKGITAASLGRLLKARGFKVAAQKLDPYINVDPGTMSPYQHGEVFVTNDGAETDLDLGHYELDLAYAITIHKSQGSEYPAVIIPLLTGPRMLMNRNLLYTAVTRARKCVTLVGDEKAFYNMEANVNEQKRYSGLRDRLEEL